LRATASGRGKLQPALDGASTSRQQISEMNAAHAALGFLIASLLTAGGMLGAAWILRVRARRFSPLKARPYECGEEANGPAWLQFHARYYLVALVFVLFDVEAVFLFPWAVNVRELGLPRWSPRDRLSWC